MEHKRLLAFHLLIPPVACVGAIGVYAGDPLSGTWCFGVACMVLAAGAAIASATALYLAVRSINAVCLPFVAGPPSSFALLMIFPLAGLAARCQSVYTAHALGKSAFLCTDTQAARLFFAAQFHST